MEALSRQQQQTQIAIETPYRNTALLQALVELPVGGEGDPLRTPAQQIGWAHRSRG